MNKGGPNGPGRQFVPIKGRFWERVTKTENGCWEYPWRTRRGRPGVSYCGDRWVAAQLAYHLTYGPIPDGLHVCHRCDNPPCVNPEHLFLGTHRDNMADRDAKGRGSKPPRSDRKGEKSPMAKLTTEDVKRIRATWKPGVRGFRQKDFAAQFGVTSSTIWSIVHRHNWPHVA